MTTKVFFESSQTVTKRLAELFNFVWPAMAGLWNLRWQVHGYSEVTGRREIKDLHERFVAGSGVTSANLKVACLETTWHEQRAQFAKFVLFNLCALYEGWLEDVCPKVYSGRLAGKMVKALQCPVSAGAGDSYQVAIAEANKVTSIALKHEFFPYISLHGKNSWATINDLLIVYRYFKLARNKLIHDGGVVDKALVDAATAFKSVPIQNVGFKRPPSFDVPNEGDAIVLDVNDVAGLGNIVHRLIITFDAALCVSIKAEAHLLERMRVAKKQFHQCLSLNPSRRHEQIQSFLGKANLPRPPVTARTTSLLRDNNLVN